MDKIVALFRQRMIPLYLPSFCFNMKLAFHHLFSFEKSYPRIGVKFQIIQKKKKLSKNNGANNELLVFLC